MSGEKRFQIFNHETNVVGGTSRISDDEEESNLISKNTAILNLQARTICGELAGEEVYRRRGGGAGTVAGGGIRLEFY